MMPVVITLCQVTAVRRMVNQVRSIGHDYPDHKHAQGEHECQKLQNGQTH